MQVEYLAGFCHLRVRLQTYQMEQISSLQDPETAEEIDDLLGWLNARPTLLATESLNQNFKIEEIRRVLKASRTNMREYSQILRSVDKAISCAESMQMNDVARRLIIVRSEIENADVPKSHADIEPQRSPKTATAISEAIQAAEKVGFPDITARLQAIAEQLQLPRGSNTEQAYAR